MLHPVIPLRISAHNVYKKLPYSLLMPYVQACEPIDLTAFPLPHPIYLTPSTSRYPRPVNPQPNAGKLATAHLLTVNTLILMLICLYCISLSRYSSLSSMIPVLRTLLPSASAIHRYNQDIDHNGVYTNFGKLNELLADRLSSLYQLNGNTVLLTSSGTIAIQSALLHYADLHAPFVPASHSLRVGVPCWTFPATIQAILCVGMTPVLIDVDSRGYMSPQIAHSVINRGIHIDIFLPVLPFGRTIDCNEWDSFNDLTQIPVVIDAASCVFSYKPSRTIAAVSLHATKGISTGEGGFLISTNTDLVGQLKRRINFGFEYSRVANVLGSNGKLSEYSAAVGLASLDDYHRLRHELTKRINVYLNLFDLHDVPGLVNSIPRDLTLTYNVYVDRPGFELDKLVSRMASEYGVEVRSWWGKAIIDQPIASYCELSEHRSLYSNSRRLSSKTVGIPFGEHITPKAQSHVVNALRLSLSHEPS